MAIDTETFRDRLLHAFPPAFFHGLISDHDECDEGIALRQELPGKTWKDVSAAFVDFNSISLPLLTPKALVAFLPAWLLRSLETISEESPLAEFTTYFLCPGSEERGWDEKGIIELVALFDDAQRSVIADFLRRIVEDEALPYWHPYAEYGLKWWSV